MFNMDAILPSVPTIIARIPLCSSPAFVHSFCPISLNIVVPQIVLPFAQCPTQTQYPNSLIPQHIIISLPVILVSLHRRINSIVIPESNTRLIPSTLLILIFIPDKLTTQLRLFDLLSLLLRWFVASQYFYHGAEMGDTEDDNQTWLWLFNFRSQVGRCRPRWER
jgi:hypothetical protein